MNHWIFERTLRLFGFPKGTPVWVSWNTILTIFFSAEEKVVDDECSCMKQLAWNALVLFVYEALGITWCNNFFIYHQGVSFISMKGYQGKLGSGLWYTRGLLKVPLRGQIYILLFRPQIRWDYPLNLSISISGGKETNQDSPSNGEWTGKSPTWKSPAFGWRIVVYRGVLCG